MKKYSAIKDMYYGNRGAYDTIKIENEEVLVLNVINECEDLLLKKLSQKPEILEIYKKLDDAIGELTCIENEHYYIEGFRFGFLMAMDFFLYKNNPQRKPKVCISLAKGEYHFDTVKTSLRQSRNTT